MPHLRLCSHVYGIAFRGATKSYEKLRKAIPYTCEHLFSMYLPPLEIGAAQIRSVTPPKPFLCVNRSPSQYGFRGGATAIQYSVNKASASLPQCNLAKIH